MSSDDNALTIILTLKDRGPFTFRWMAYADKIHIPFKILIADGGQDKSVEQVLKRPDSYKNLTYEYIRYPFDKSYTEYYRKLADSLLRVETPFVVLADNDDFYFVDGLRRSIEFLDRNSEYTSCRGLMGGFILDQEDKSPSLGEVYGDDAVLTMPPLLPSISNDTSTSRVAEHFSNYSPTYYDVHRTKVMSTCFRKLSDLDPENVMLAELLTSFLTVAQGKIHRGEYLYLIRQGGLNDNNSKLDRQKWGDHFNRMLANTWSADFTGFTESLAEVVSTKDGLTIDKTKTHVKQSFREYLAPQVTDALSHDIPGSGKNPIRRFRDLVVKLPVQSKSRRVAQWVYKQYTTTRRFAANLLRGNSGIQQMSLSNPSRYHKELRLVYDVIKSPPIDIEAKSDGQRIWSNSN